MVYAEAQERKTTQLVCNNNETLLWLANVGCIEMHPMHSSVIDYEKCQQSHDLNDIGYGLNLPDFVVIDLDPYIYPNTQNQEKTEQTPYNIQAFKTTVEVALELKEQSEASLEILYQDIRKDESPYSYSYFKHERELCYYL